MSQPSATLDRAPVSFRTRPRRRVFRPSRIAILAFLFAMALLFCVPLYVVVVTSFKTMDEIRLGRTFDLPHIWTIDAWRSAWTQACSGLNCGGVSVGFINSMWI